MRTSESRLVCVYRQNSHHDQGCPSRSMYQAVQALIEYPDAVTGMEMSLGHRVLH